jgi:hypothetical protein
VPFGGSRIEYLHNMQYLCHALSNICTKFDAIQYSYHVVCKQKTNWIEFGVFLRKNIMCNLECVAISFLPLSLPFAFFLFIADLLLFRWIQCCKPNGESCIKSVRTKLWLQLHCLYFSNFRVLITGYCYSWLLSEVSCSSANQMHVLPTQIQVMLWNCFSQKTTKHSC